MDPAPAAGGGTRPAAGGGRGVHKASAATCARNCADRWRDGCGERRRFSVQNAVVDGGLAERAQVVRTAPVVGREDRLAAADPPCRAPSGCCGRHGPATRRMPPLEAYEPPNSGHIRPGERHTRTGEGRPAGRLSSNPHIWRHTRTDKRQPLEVKNRMGEVPRQRRALEVAQGRIEASSSIWIGIPAKGARAVGVAPHLTGTSRPKRPVGAWRQLTTAAGVQRPSVPGRPRCCGHPYGSAPWRQPRRSPCRSDGSAL